MATFCSILAQKMPWIEEPVGLYSPQNYARIRDGGISTCLLHPATGKMLPEMKIS